MPTYRVTDPNTGTTLKLTGDSPPSEKEIMQAFEAYGGRQGGRDDAKGAEKTFWGGVGESLSKRAGNIADQWVAPGDESMMDSFIKAGGRIFRTAGQVAGGAGDIFGEAVKAGYQSLVPEEARKEIAGGIRGAMQSGPGQALLSGVQTVSDVYGKAKQRWPEDVGNLEAAANILGVVPMGLIGGKGIKAAEAATDIAKGAVTPMTTVAKVDKMIDAAVEKGFKRGIKPSYVGKADANQVKRYFDSAKMAVKDIVENSTTPLSKSENILEDFSASIAEARKRLWDRAAALSRGQTNIGQSVSLRPAINDLYKISSDENLIRSNASLAAKVRSMADEWAAMPDSISPSQAEDLLTKLNNEARAFWKDPNMNTQAALYERVAQNVRKELYDLMEGMSGPEYRDLRKKYGAHLAIEKEVTNRATQYGRRNEFGFMDLANIPVAGEFVRSVISMDAPGVLKAGAMLAAKRQMKKANDAAEIIRKMFREVEGLSEKKAALAGKAQSAPDASGIMPPRPELPMPERGFQLVGDPFDDGIIDVPFRSVGSGAKLLPEARFDQTKMLPPGQGFGLAEDVWPITSNVKMKRSYDDYLRSLEEMDRQDVVKGIQTKGGKRRK